MSIAQLLRIYSTLLLMRLAIFRIQRSRNLSGGITAAEVGSYPAISTLPDHLKYAYTINILRGQAVYFLLRCLSTACFQTESRVLPGIMPCGARTFLPDANFMSASERQPDSSLKLLFGIDVDDFFFFLIIIFFVFFHFVKVGKSPCIFSVEVVLFAFA